MILIILITFLLFFSFIAGINVERKQSIKVIQAFSDKGIGTDFFIPSSDPIFGDEITKGVCFLSDDIEPLLEFANLDY